MGLGEADLILVRNKTYISVKIMKVGGD